MLSMGITEIGLLGEIICLPQPVVSEDREE